MILILSDKTNWLHQLSLLHSLSVSQKFVKSPIHWCFPHLQASPSLCYFRLKSILMFSNILLVYCQSTVLNSINKYLLKGYPTAPLNAYKVEVSRFFTYCLSAYLRVIAILHFTKIWTMENWPYRETTITAICSTLKSKRLWPCFEFLVYRKE